jgi:DNA-directed RNA polymerase
MLNDNLFADEQLEDSKIKHISVSFAIVGLYSKTQALPMTHNANTTTDMDAQRPVESETNSQMERQRLREKTIGVKKIQRNKSAELKADHQLVHHSQQLLEEAILTLLLGSESNTSNKTIGDLRQSLRANLLQPVQDALKELLAARRGKPNNLKTFWNLLELPAQEDDPERFNEFSEIVFYGTLNEMLISVLTTEKSTIVNDANDEDENAENDVGEATFSEPEEKVDWPWIPERQLYQRVWQAFLLDLVSWLSRGEVKLPGWLSDAAKAKASGLGDFMDVDFEDRLEKAFQSALMAPASTSATSRVRKSALDPVRAKQASEETTQVQTPEDIPPKPFTEAAEEFAATLVFAVASVAGDDLFVWFKREQPVRKNGKVMRRTKSSWVPTKTLLDRIKTLPIAPDVYSVPVNAPLLIPPKPWRVETLHQGGYYTRRIGFYKFYLKNDRIRDFLQACHTPEIAPVLDAVNQIQSTPFRINQRVWSVVDQMLTRVDTLTNKTARKKVEKASYDTYLETRFSPKAFNPKVGEKVGDRLRWPLTRKMVTELAQPTDGDAAEPFYFAYNADTRGRLYPIFQWLSPQGEDLSRALLEFAHGKAITEAGAECLAIHGSQQVRFETILRDLGIKEERPPTLEERRHWVKMHEAEIIQYADDPLTHMGWTDTKSPYLFLAFCFAWADYVKYGTTAICHLPVHVDGVCNGLQHIAALTGDPKLAAATNLQPGLPQDIYLHVKQLALAQLEQTAGADPYAAFALEHKLVNRDLAKTVVMIIPYGAGDSGTAKSVRNRLRGRMFPNKRSFEETTPLGKAFIAFLHKHFPESMAEVKEKDGRRIQPLAVHLTKLTLCIVDAFTKQLSEQFPAIAVFKRELVSSASAVFSSGHPMMWQAPSGLPVMQRSFKVSETVVDCRISSAAFGTLDLSRKKHTESHKRIKFTAQRISNEVHERDQQSGILPNFIHSLDSAHLIATVQLAVNRGVTDFSVIHDSYGTHAADMPVLAACIRAAFVTLYAPVECPPVTIAIRDEQGEPVKDEKGKIITARIPGEEISPLTRYLQWCAVLSIAAKAPHIDVEQFTPYIKLTNTEKALYNLIAQWAGRGSQMLQEMAREAPRIVERMLESGQMEVKVSDKTHKKLLEFAADEITLEWPTANAAPDLSGCLDSKYFFS